MKAKNNKGGILWTCRHCSSHEQPMVDFREEKVYNPGEDLFTQINKNFHVLFLTCSSCGSETAKWYYETLDKAKEIATEYFQFAKNNY